LDNLSLVGYITYRRRAITSGTTKLEQRLAAPGGNNTNDPADSVVIARFVH
jgi:hypothetical protein